MKTGFKKLPMFLFTSYKELSSDAKIIYSVLADRKSLSEKNGWTDENGVFVIFTLNEICEYIPSSKSKASRVLRELRDAGLISRKRMGQGNADHIYVRDPEDACSAPASELCGSCGSAGSEISDDTYEEPLSFTGETLKLTVSAPKETDSINTNKTIYLSVRSSKPEGGLSDRVTDHRAERLTDMVARNTGLDMDSDDPVDRMALDVIGEVMATVDSSVLKINGENKPASVVKSYFLKLDRRNMDNFMYRFANFTDLHRVKNKRAYIRSMLYNSCFEDCFSDDAALRYGT